MDNYNIIIINSRNEIIEKSPFIGSKENMNDLAYSFFNIISSTDPDKYKDSKPALMLVENERDNL